MFLSIIYQGLKDKEADKLSASSLVETAYGLKCPINRVVRLGRRIENKHRPLLICFECIDDKAVVVSCSYQILSCHHDTSFIRHRPAILH